MSRRRPLVLLIAVLATSLPGRAFAQDPESPPPPASLQEQAELCRQQLDLLRRALPPSADAGLVVQAAAQDKGDEKLRKLVEVQQKQIEVLEKMIRLIADQLKKQQPLPAAVEKLQNQADFLEGRNRRGAERDQELAAAVDDLREQQDAQSLNGPAWPATLKELFLPTRTNESPLAIYGTLAADYQDFQDRNSNFGSPVFSPHFYMLLNENILFEVNPEIRGDRIELESAQIDFFLTDWLNLIVGRFYSPLGFFNERLHTSWIYKTPDRPLMFTQVLPASLSFNGVLLHGAHFIADWPVKLEYSAFVSNGMSLEGANLGPRDFADLNRVGDVFDDVNNSRAAGGRLGLNFPELGLIVGVSGLANGAYDRAGRNDLNLWDVDVSWHRGNWDFRFEYAEVHQQAVPTRIRRHGMYAQLAYRDYENCNPFLSRLEGVVRFDHVQFDGINLAVTGLDFPTRERIPVDRNRYTFGVNYYVYPSLIVKFAYEVNDELRFRELKDNGFIAQITWGW